jgi:hypothetical protein
VIVSRVIHVRLRNVLDKSLEKMKTHFMFNDFFFKSRLFDIMLKNMAQPDWSQMTV